ncbi:MAG: lysylphosphatidylglycerol synthase transmembrane domain-containing protein [Chloroflexota bacterium]
MLAEKQTAPPTPPSASRRLWQWLNLLLALGLTAVGLWFIGRNVSLADIGDTLIHARFSYILLGFFIMLLTIWVKNWRWQLLLATPTTHPPFGPLFWAMTLGQYVNLIIPFLRLGEIARIYALHQQTDISKARALGTLVVEKTLDLIFFAATLIILLPLVVLPDFVGNPSTLVGTIALFLLLILYLLAYQTSWVIRTLRWLFGKLPAAIGQRLLHVAVDGLEGLAALRSPRLSLLLVGSSIMVALLAAILPAVLFPAFNLPFGLLEGALMHIVVSVVTTPPSTPAKIGVFNSAAALLLLSLNAPNEAAVIGYSIAFHLVVMLPQIILGSIAATRTRWQWPTTLKSSTSGDIKSSTSDRS